jgi:MoaA/NifB/PqqE/SkfB family radical SAM enzyme
MINNSFISASTFPIKVLQNEVIKNDRIVPFHVQLYPTNLCNLKCSFCSCANRNKTDCLSLDDIKRVMLEAINLGCKAVTISGGGEPTLHPRINEILEFLFLNKLQVGMATNGVSLSRVKTDMLDSLTWCRISHSDDREFKGKHKTQLLDIIKQCKYVDWGFSYVVTSKLNEVNLLEIIRTANENNFTHVRLVSDLLDLESAQIMEYIKELLQSENIDDSLVIYQGRKDFTKGTKKCLISLLKPVINADGNIYPCCGAQYAFDPPTLDCSKVMSMGKLSDLKLIYEEQRNFDGSICSRCYYNEYNILLDKMTGKLKHKEFI